MELFEGYFDGACQPVNPGGHASWGAQLELNGKKIWSDFGYIGFGPMMSNNVAEYCGLIALQEYLAKQMHGAFPGERLIIYGDSQLVIKQMNGEYKAKRGLYLPFYHKAKSLKEVVWAEYRWIPREKNGGADALSQMPLIKMGIEINYDQK